MQQGIVTKSRSKPRNILRGLVPTADATWGTPPSNLSNATNGDLSSATGTGSKTTSGGADAGKITIDSGQTAPFILGVLFGYYITANTLNVYFEGNNDNGSTWYLLTNTSTQSTSEVIRTMICYSTYRYVRIRFTSTGTATVYARLFEVAGYLMGL